MIAPIGFIGVGIMGKGMIKNLVSKLNRPVVIWNRGVEASNEMKSQFPDLITIATTPADVISQCETTFCMLSTPEASASVFEAPNGVFSAVTAGKIIVDCATLTPERMIEEKQIITAKGGLFLEAPVSGSKVPAETGQLIFLCGGDESVFTTPDVHAGLEAMGKASFLFGDAGQGTRVKLVVNMIMGTMLTAFTEGCALADAADIPLDKLLAVLDLGAMANPLFRAKGPNMINDKYDPHFPLKHAQKDMKFALGMSEGYGLELPTTEASNAVFVKALDAGKGDEDFSAVYTASKNMRK
jgi:3-hydroxyisobutyrate dehydrogenase-like beta-hydroxyacid dehydrogenase